MVHFTFYCMVVFSQMLAFGIVGWLAYFVRHYFEPSWKFGFIYHPVLMTGGFVVLQGEAILIYRALRRFSKLPLKLVHAGLHLAAIAVTITGVFGEVENKKTEPYPYNVHFHNIHEWTGLAILIVYGLQWFTGFVTFLLPVCSDGVRKAALPIHTTLGISLFFLTMAQILSGMTYQSAFACYDTKDPDLKDICRYQENSLSLLMLLYTLVVAYCVIPEKFKRVERAQLSSNTVDVYHVSTEHKHD